jgi:hypothetical protein
MAQPYVAIGDLVRVLPSVRVNVGGLVMIYPSTRLLALEIAAFHDCMAGLVPPGVGRLQQGMWARSTAIILDVFVN